MRRKPAPRMSHTPERELLRNIQPDICSAIAALRPEYCARAMEYRVAITSNSCDTGHTYFAALGGTLVRDLLLPYFMEHGRIVEPKLGPIRFKTRMMRFKVAIERRVQYIDADGVPRTRTEIRGPPPMPHTTYYIPACEVAHVASISAGDLSARSRVYGKYINGRLELSAEPLWIFNGIRKTDEMCGAYPSQCSRVLPCGILYSRYFGAGSKYWIATCLRGAEPREVLFCNANPAAYYDDSGAECELQHAQLSEYHAEYEMLEVVK